MKFVNPQALYALFLLIPISCVLFISSVCTRKVIRKLLNQDLSERIALFHKIFNLLSSVSLTLFFTAMIIALADPVFGKPDIPDDQKPTDILFVVDISRSMTASDIYPTRLEKSSEIIRLILTNNHASRAGLILFKGSAYNIIPLTEDFLTFDPLLGTLTPNILSSPGTNIEAGLKKAITSFPDNDFHQKAVILITDGEAIEGKAVSMAKSYIDNEIQLIILGAGTSEGTPFSGEEGETVKDVQGNVVYSKLDQRGLEKLSVAARGMYHFINDPDLINKVSREIKASKMSSQTYPFGRVRRYRFFIFIALVSLFFSFAFKYFTWRGIT